LTRVAAREQKVSPDCHAGLREMVAVSLPESLARVRQ
jgi:hypothetical protein